MIKIHKDKTQLNQLIKHTLKILVFKNTMV